MFEPGTACWEIANMTNIISALICISNAAAEYCNANFDRMDELINEVLKNASNRRQNSSPDTPFIRCIEENYYRRRLIWA
jgi:hypothetical protein